MSELLTPAAAAALAAVPPAACHQLLLLLPAALPVRVWSPRACSHSSAHARRRQQQTHQSMCATNRIFTTCKWCLSHQPASLMASVLVNKTGGHTEAATFALHVLAYLQALQKVYGTLSHGSSHSSSPWQVHVVPVVHQLAGRVQLLNGPEADAVNLTRLPPVAAAPGKTAGCSASRGFNQNEHQPPMLRLPKGGDRHLAVIDASHSTACRVTRCRPCYTQSHGVSRTRKRSALIMALFRACLRWSHDMLQHPGLHPGTKKLCCPPKTDKMCTPASLTIPAPAAWCSRRWAQAGAPWWVLAGTRRPAAPRSAEWPAAAPACWGAAATQPPA